MIIPIPTMLWKVLFIIGFVGVAFLRFTGEMSNKDLLLSGLGLFMMFILPTWVVNWVKGGFK